MYQRWAASNLAASWLTSSRLRLFCRWQIAAGLLSVILAGTDLNWSIIYPLVYCNLMPSQPFLESSFGSVTWPEGTRYRDQVTQCECWSCREQKVMSFSCRKPCPLLRAIHSRFPCQFKKTSPCSSHLHAHSVLEIESRLLPDQASSLPLNYISHKTF